MSHFRRKSIVYAVGGRGSGITKLFPKALLNANVGKRLSVDVSGFYYSVRAPAWEGGKIR